MVNWENVLTTEQYVPEREYTGRKLHSVRLQAINCNRRGHYDIVCAMGMHVCLLEMPEQFLSRVSTLTRDNDIAILSVRLSVTRWYCIKTA